MVKLQEVKCGKYKTWNLAIPKDIVQKAKLKKGDSFLVSYDSRSEIITIERIKGK